VPLAITVMAATATEGKPMNAQVWIELLMVVLRVLAAGQFC
jgi:hypothetical protein